MAVNMSNLSNAVTIIDHAKIATDITNGGFGISLLVMIFMITFISLKSLRTEQALAASSFLTLIMAYFMIGLGWINDSVFIVLGIITAIIAMIVFFGMKKS